MRQKKKDRIGHVRLTMGDDEFEVCLYLGSGINHLLAKAKKSPKGQATALYGCVVARKLGKGDSNGTEESEAEGGSGD